MIWNGSKEVNNRHIDLGGTNLQLKVTDTGGGVIWKLHHYGRTVVHGDCDDFADGELQAELWLLRFWLAIGRQLEA